MRHNNDHSLCRVHHKVVAIPCVQEALKGQCSCVSVLDKLSATLCWNNVHAVCQPTCVSMCHAAAVYQHILL